MSDATPPTLSPPAAIPTPREPWEHPMSPDLVVPRHAPAPPAADEPYAHWWRRVVAALIDMVLVIPFWVVGIIGIWVCLERTTFLTDGTGGLGSIRHVVTTNDTWVGGAVAALDYLSLIVFGIWNQIVRQGRRGASIGKACLHLMVVNVEDGRPIGVLATFVRNLAHLLDGIVFYLGYLWPLVDSRRQTFADKVMNTVVLHLPPRRR